MGDMAASDAMLISLSLQSGGTVWFGLARFPMADYTNQALLTAATALLQLEQEQAMLLSLWASSEAHDALYDAMAHKLLELLAMKPSKKRDAGLKHLVALWEALQNA